MTHGPLDEQLRVDRPIGGRPVARGDLKDYKAYGFRG